MHVNLKIVSNSRSLSLILTIWLGFTALIASCGSRKNESPQEVRNPDETGSQAAPEAPPVNKTAQGQEDRPAIVTFGDSLTAGVAGRSYPDDLQDLLDEHGYRFQVDNQGVSGDTTTDGLARIDNVVDHHPALVVLEFGGNDGLRGIPVEATRRNLQEMIERLKTAKIPVALLGITLPPNYGPEFVKPFTAIFTDLAKQYRLPFLPFLLADVYKDAALMQPDGIHPNGDGNKIVAQDVFRLIQPLLGKAETPRK